MNYAEQLETVEWKTRRKLILERDNMTCHKCLNNSYHENLMFGVLEAQTTFKSKIWDYINAKIIFCNTPNRLDFKQLSGKICFYKFEDNHQILFSVIDIDFPFQPEQVRSSIITYASIYHNEERYSLKNNISSAFKYSTLSKEDINQQMDLKKWLYLRNLNIHHKYYQEGKMAWEYPDEALETLCWPCHENIHKNSVIDILDINGKLLSKREVCTRCYGAGWFPQYKHVESGICFKCNGSRFDFY